MSPAYNYATYLQARQALALRLTDPANQFWPDAELKLLIIESLRTWNALTAAFVKEAAFTVKAASSPWLFVPSLTNSPRPYTVQDSDIYTLIQYHLIEPATGAGTWSGTPQFSLSDLTQAYQRRQDELVQLTACNLVQLAPLGVVPNTRRTLLPDTVLEVRRARYIPGNNPPSPPHTLWREDPYTFSVFTPGFAQTPHIPHNYSLTNQPPLSLDTDFPPNIPGTLDLLAIQSTTPPAPPASVNLAIPDDWSWVLKWGILADILNKDSESQDLPRAQYCLARYTEGITLMQRLPWLLGAQFDGIPVGIAGVQDQDQYDNGWESRAGVVRNAVVVAGTDLISVCPRPTGATLLGLTLQLVQNAPIPVADSDPVQVSRDTLDIILDYAEHLASFQMGGQEFAATVPLFDNFRKSAQLTNQRLAELGIFYDVMKWQGRREESADPRFAVPAQ